MLMTGGSSPASHLHRSMHERKAFQPAFHRVAPVEMNHLPCSVRQLQTGRHHLLQPDRTVSSVGNSGGTGNDVAFCKHNVVQLQFQGRRASSRKTTRVSPSRPRQTDRAAPEFCVLRPESHRRHTGNRQPVSHPPDTHPRKCSGNPLPIRRKFLRQRIQRKRFCLPRIVGISGKSNIFL